MDELKKVGFQESVLRLFFHLGLHVSQVDVRRFVLCFPSFELAPHRLAVQLTGNCPVTYTALSPGTLGVEPSAYR